MFDNEIHFNMDNVLDEPLTEEEEDFFLDLEPQPCRLEYDRDYFPHASF